MKNIVSISLTAFFLLIGKAYSIDTLRTSKFSDVIFKGKVTDSLINKRPDGKTTVTVLVSKYPFSSVNMLGAESKRYEKEVSYNEPFNFHISSPAKRFYMSVYYNPARGHKGVYINDINWSNFDNVYILEQGDSIQADLNKDYYEFTGRGSKKLNCESEIYKQNYYYGNEFSKALRSGEYNGYFDLISQKMDSCFLIQTGIVKKHSAELGEEMTAILLANCYSLRYYASLRGHRQAFTDQPGLYSAIVNSSAFKRIDGNVPDKIPPETLVQAPLYVDFLFEKIRLTNFRQKDGLLQLPLSIQRTFADIKQQYHGIIRDKLFALFFANYNSIPTSMNYLNEAISLSGASIYKDFLLNLQQTKTKGLPFFPFELPDTKGRIVKLSDLGDKVVVLDFWYSGCENCIHLHHAMSAIHNLYQNNPNVAFVSVSIDKDKNAWLRSVAKCLYTDPTDINLYTDGKEAKHPLLKKYSIEAFPYTFILKNGKIFSSSPPYPNGKSINEAGTKEFVDLMEEAIRVDDQAFPRMMAK